MKQSKENKEDQLFKTDGGRSKSNAIQIPSVNLPKGGGAIKGIDEKFSVNAVNGTSAFSIPLPFSPARALTPSLSLSYNSGNGNGVFGLGWSLDLASIKRKTDKGLPQYLDDIDTFLFSEAEDLVPSFKKNPDGRFALDASGEYIIDEADAPEAGYVIRYYRPRVEGLFARIERWRQNLTGEIRWRITTRENVTTLFGWSANARIADPNDPGKIYQWLPEFVFDDKGNCTQYIYKKEDGSGFDPGLLHNKNRTTGARITYTNTYLEKIIYGNRIPYRRFGNAWPEQNSYFFSTVFDYGEYRALSPYDRSGNWEFRPDSFSDYKAGFEIRTTRICKRVLLFHHFSGPGEYDGLVRSVNFEYDTRREPDFSFLISATVSGYIKMPDGSYSQKSMPPMEFTYQPHEWNKVVKAIGAENLVHAPEALDEQQYQFTDLYNEGLAGILTEQGDEWYYKHNLGNGEFARAKLVSPRPSFAGLNGPLHLADLDADGGKQLVSYKDEYPGYFQLDDENNWNAFRTFTSVPSIDISDANTRMLDLNGDGKAEVVITEENVFTWYPSLGRKGFAASKKTIKPANEEQGPHILFADVSQSIFLADMSGDGLTDIVRIRNGEVCYWPNLGYGKFGAKISMDHAPLFDHPDRFHPSNLRLADIDGSGTTDIVYLGKNKFSCWRNLSGNRFSTTAFEIDAFPDVHQYAKITVTDLLGNGVACIVWSSSLPKDAGSPLRYIDLMNSRKPHIMTGYKNNLGKEVSLEYEPSTKFYLEDKKAGKPWVTKLHFPVHCVTKTVTEDKITGARFVSEYKYHHGYYDHAEREFRGFGMVEQTDAETYEHWVKSGASNIVEQPLHQEPVISKLWHHTGAFMDRDRILHQYSEEYWYREMEKAGYPVTHSEHQLPEVIITANNIPGTSFIENLSVQDWQEAFRACKGMALRTETFARDAIHYGNTGEAKRRELIPYHVTAKNFVIEVLQPKGKNNHAVFLIKDSESITYNYERDIADPRITHQLNIKFDRYGNVLETAAVVYPRRIIDASLPDGLQAQQGRTVITFTESSYTNDVITAESFRLRLPSESKTWELKGVEKTDAYYATADFENILSDSRSDAAHYHELNKPLLPGRAQRRLIEHTRSVYYSNRLNSTLRLHELESLAIPYESYQLAYSPDLLTDIFGTRTTDALMDEGKFTHSEGDVNWWVRSGTSQYIAAGESVVHAAERFYLPLSYTDPYGAITRVKYYGDYFLFIEETEDALGNRSGVQRFNFRTLSPQRMYDINRNLSEVLTDELGMVKALAVMGKGEEADELTNLSEVTSSEEGLLIDRFLNAADSLQMQHAGKQLLQRSTTRFVYDLNCYIRDGKPAAAASIMREQHFRDNADSPVQISFEYSDGGGEVVMKKVQAEPGVAKQVLVNPDNTIRIIETDTSAGSPRLLRWIANGRTINNNKGNPVKQYQPYFSVNHHYEDYRELVETGFTPVNYYDAAGRLVKTDMPDGSFSKVEFDSWKEVSFDPNDTVEESDWYKKRTDNTRSDFISDPGEQQSAAKTHRHNQTPVVKHFDSLGRPVLSVEHNRNTGTGADEFYHTSLVVDTEGNLRAVTDARGNTVMQYKYDMLGNKVYQNSMDAGQRWTLINIAGKPLRSWDERNHEFQYSYDIHQRPVFSKVTGGDGPTRLDNIFGRVIYGESLLVAGRLNERELQIRNVLGQIVKHYDTGGLISIDNYDFKGKPLATTRRLFRKYKEVANWTDGNLAGDLEAEDFTFSNDLDALGRITRQVAPDGSIITPSYNEAGMLNGETVLHPGAAAPAVYIKDIDYNEKGQRKKIVYGNDVITRFYYDEQTLRLVRLHTMKHNGDSLQDWKYTYDPVGNITQIEDRNVPLSFFDNRVTTGISDYTYDALYRLVEATGRENDAALSFNREDNWNDQAFMQHLSPRDPMAIRNYRETYQYDEVGNIEEMRHNAPGNNWIRGYTYESNNNRLVNTRVGSITYSYPPHPLHGFITAMPHLEEMTWNFKEELVKTIRQRRTDGGIAETTYYQYDGNGQRIRKVTENQADTEVLLRKKEERIYIAGFELYKKHSGTAEGLERVSLSLMDEGHRYVMIETRNEIDDGTEEQLVRYQLHNHLGSANMELDRDAEVISYEEYHPYGTTAFQAKNRIIRSAAKRYRFTGMERDEENGLEYHSARYYLPWLGRWLSADPIGIEDGVNVYCYVKGNPITKNDCNGLQAVPTQSQIQNAAIQTVNMSRADRVALMDRIAARFGIPAGGFRWGARLYTQTPPDLRFYWPLRDRLRSDWGSRAAAGSLQRANTYVPEISPYLVLTTGAREHEASITPNTRGTVDTYAQGGIDHLWSNRNELGLPPAIVRRWRDGGSFINFENRRLVHPAIIPERDQLLAYAAQTRASYINFQRHVARIIGQARADAVFRGLSDDARMVWQAYAFLAPHGAEFDPRIRSQHGRGFGVETAFGYLLHRATTAGREVDLNSILTDSSLNNTAWVRMARVRAAEAAFLQEMVTHPPAVPSPPQVPATNRQNP